MPKEDCLAIASSAGEGSRLCRGDNANMLMLLVATSDTALALGLPEACLASASSAGDGSLLCLGETAAMSMPDAPEALLSEDCLNVVLELNDKSWRCLREAEGMSVLSLSDMEGALPRGDLVPLTCSRYWCVDMQHKQDLSVSYKRRCYHGKS